MTYLYSPLPRRRHEYFFSGSLVASLSLSFLTLTFMMSIFIDSDPHDVYLSIPSPSFPASSQLRYHEPVTTHRTIYIFPLRYFRYIVLVYRFEDG
ncbi:hypothetical protein BDV98DRAFT_189645 [Pterulicium gracile]|uniref:Uncharacterized protein n=1 Tax=Pterulicium gracile TaxID=1884261 RepID=A0A5C3QEN8_9AGAR|nr:hypothetical protein BDV98DRAFT_189645 [Pterula gracilis]